MQGDLLQGFPRGGSFAITPDLETWQTALMVNLGPLLALGLCGMVLATLCYLANFGLPSAQEPESVEERQPEPCTSLTRGLRGARSPTPLLPEFTIRYAHEIEEALEHDQFAAAAITAAIDEGVTHKQADCEGDSCSTNTLPSARNRNQ